jgi:hypothetical protein
LAGKLIRVCHFYTLNVSRTIAAAADIDAELGRCQVPKQVVGVQQLKPLDDLNKVFLNPRRDYLHIIVQRPPGE